MPIESFKHLACWVAILLLLISMQAEAMEVAPRISDREIDRIASQHQRRHQRTESWPTGAGTQNGSAL